MSIRAQAAAMLPQAERRAGHSESARSDFGMRTVSLGDAVGGLGDGVVLDAVLGRMCAMSGPLLNALPSLQRQSSFLSNGSKKKASSKRSRVRWPLACQREDKSDRSTSAQLLNCTRTLANFPAAVPVLVRCGKKSIGVHAAVIIQWSGSFGLGWRSGNNQLRDHTAEMVAERTGIDCRTVKFRRQFWAQMISSNYAVREIPSPE
ncbi:hypothetical protein B0H17DRAFT_1142734 [Mycena rosella]|uniref:Uncharacterized protein n=1 Tax=Mycena rosella TaxID=1033263 RepID=A0AAD7CX69_MYCRO|nr:hypothetical protein B0H17DRAFT_1142734 [Mycena rosella]